MLELLVGAVGLGLSLTGALGSYNNQQSAAAAQQQQAAINAQVGRLQAANVGLQQKVADVQYTQQIDQINTNKSIIGLQSQGEDIRNASMNLDAARQTRQGIRQMIQAQALSTARASAQGASFSDSAVQGARSQIAAQGENSLLNVRQAQAAGNALFDLNRSITQTYLGAQDRSLGYLDQRQGYESQQRLNQQKIFRLGAASSSISGQLAQYQADASLYQGIGGIGNLLLGNTTNISNTARSLPGLFG